MKKINQFIILIGFSLTPFYLESQDSAKIFTDCEIIFGNHKINISGGHNLSISKAEFLEIDSMYTNCDYEITNYEVTYFTPLTQDSEKIENNKISDRFKSFIKSCSVGKKFFIYGLQIKRKGDSSKVFIPPILVTIKE